MKALNILLFIFLLASSSVLAQVTTSAFPSTPATDCSLMKVDVLASTSENNLFEVKFCNYGSQKATNVYIEIEISDGLMITNATVPATLHGSVFRFDLMDLNPDYCSKFYIEIPNKGKGLECVNARIFPNNPCQAVVDEYTTVGIVDGGINTGEGGTQIDEANIFSLQDKVSAGTTPGGQGGTNSVFEDNVVLNNIPNWDSLITLLNDNTGGSSGGNTGVNETPLLLADATDIKDNIDITGFSYSEDCRNEDTGNTTVFNTGLTGNNAQSELSVYGSLGQNIIDNNNIGNNTINNSGTSTAASTVNTMTVEDEIVNVAVYPNPFSTSTTIEIQDGSYETIALQLMDVSGRVIKEVNNIQNNKVVLYRESLSQGLYIYRLYEEGNVIHTGKLIVQ